MTPFFHFGTVGSPISTPSKPGGSLGAILHLSSLGFGALELGWVQSVRISPETCAVIKDSASIYSVAISVHAPYFINLNANDEEWPQSRKRLMDAAWYGFLAGATDVVFHPGSYFGQPASAVLPTVLKRLSGCVDELISRDIDIILRPETMGKSAMLGSLEDTLEMSQLPGVLPCLDFAHLHARSGDGSVNGYDSWTKILDQYAASLGKNRLQSLHIHLSGIKYGLKGEQNHLPIRECDLDIKGLFNALKDHDCAGRILCESPIMEEGSLWSVWVGFAIYGFFAGGFNALAKAIISDTAPLELKATAYGIYYTFVGIATLVSLALGGIVWDRFGSTPLFTFSSLGALLLAALLYRMRQRLLHIE